MRRVHHQPPHVTPPLVALMLLSAVAGVRGVAAPLAGVAGGAGGAERTETDPVLNGTEPYRFAGTIREALGGGVIEPETHVQMQALEEPEPHGTVPQEHAPYGAQSSGASRDSRCGSPLACIRVEHCANSPSVIFECRQGRVCCLPAKRPLHSNAPTAQVYRPTPPTNQVYQPPTEGTDEEYHHPSGVTNQEYQPAAVASNQEYQPPAVSTNQEYQSPAGATNQEYQPPAAATNEDYQAPAGATNEEYQPPAGATNQVYQPQGGITNMVYQPGNTGVLNQVYQPATVDKNLEQVISGAPSGNTPDQVYQPDKVYESGAPVGGTTNQVHQPTISTEGVLSEAHQPSSVPDKQGVPIAQRPTTPRPPPRVTTKAPSTTPALSPRLPNLHLLPDTKTCGVFRTEDRITNGKMAMLGQFPWMALLGYRLRGNPNVTYLCGGTLINDRYVLTAAHCFSSQSRIVHVRLGELNLTTPIDCDHLGVCAPEAEDIPVENVITHPAFNIRNIKNDIALIRLRRSISNYTAYIRPICLPVDVNVTDDAKFKIAGWGKIDFKDVGGSESLQFTQVNGVNHSECDELQPLELRPLAQGQMCAGGDKGKDACKGDSGGPLMVTLPATDHHVTYQIGVVSYGPDSPCGIMPLPSIYTRVSTYLPWILNTMKP